MAIIKLPSSGDAPRSTGVPESLIPGGAVDSAGFPWAGRTFDHHETAFAGDIGETPEALRDAVAEVHSAAAEFLDADDPENFDLDRLKNAHIEAMLALSGCRVLIPLLAEAGDFGLTPEGRVVEKSQELSIVTVSGPDGRRAMPVFSSVDAMRVWNPEARPIPVPMPQAAVAAAQDETALIIVDPGTPGSEVGVRRTQLEAVALAQPVSPAWADASVQKAFQASVAEDPQVLGIFLMPGDPEARLLAPELDLVLEIRPGLGQEELSQLLAGIQRKWATSETIAGRVDSMRVRVV